MRPLLLCRQKLALPHALHVTPSGRDAIALALDGVRPDGEVWITSSVGTALHRLSPCVAQAVSRRARVADRPSDRTVGVVVVHEWGFPHPERDGIVELARQHRWRVVDDCAHAFQHGLDLAQGGATVAFSLPKFLPVASGGLLANPSPLDTQRSFALSPGAREAAIADLLRQIPARCAAHVANWQRLDALASARGWSSIDRLTAGVVPQVYRLRIERQLGAQSAAAELGVETTPPFYTGWLALPCHADLPTPYWERIERWFQQVKFGLRLALGTNG